MSFIAGYLLGLGQGGGSVKPIAITKNGEYDAAYDEDPVIGYNPVTVDVSPVIESLTVECNGTYRAPEGIDGYDPVDVQVPDRYDEGYQDGYQDGYNQGCEDTRTEILTNPDDPTHIAIHDQGYRDGYDVGYDNGFDFASNFFNSVVDSQKRYTIIFYIGEKSTWTDVRYLRCSVRYTADMSEIYNFNWWPTDSQLCYNARFTKIWWQYGNATDWNVPQVEIESTDASGNNKKRYTRPFYKSEIWPSDGYNPYNTNIISSVPT